MLRRVREFLDRRSRSSILALVLLMAGAIAVPDYLTGTDVGLLPLYWIPVTIGAWYIDAVTAAALGVLIAVVICWFDLHGGRVFHNPMIGIASEFATRALSMCVLAALVANLRERTRALQSAVAQLRAFDYSIAHDLRSPVRAISSFADLISRREGRLEETSRRYLSRITAASLRLSAMLEGLLLLSGLSEKSVHRETIDLGALARQILSDLEVELDGPKRELALPGSLKVFADRQLLTVLLQDLLQNAWKFTSRKPAPRIELGTVPYGGEPVFFIKDNGEGFDPAYSNQLFRPFSRLPNAEGFPGQGIGLATAAQVVQSHGGRIWAEGSLEKGATIYFTLEAVP